MAYASIEDVNKFLDATKVVVTDQDDDNDQESAERIIRGYLAGHIDPTVIASWATPQSTPELIRDIAGRFVAAFRYRALYAEDVNEVSPYAQNLYNEAIDMLKLIVSGEMSITGTDDVVVDVEAGSSFDRSMFYPTKDQDDDPFHGRKFGMGLTF